jgi:hypothetical protein
LIIRGIAAIHRDNVVTVCLTSNGILPHEVGRERLMVKIRYSELPAGLHVVVEADGRGAIIYLLPGLTPAQRRAALIRARSSARMGQGPPLPALGMAAAVAADRARTTVINGAAAMRRHPMLLLPPLIVLVSGALVVVLTSVVTLAIPPHSKASFSGPRVVSPHPRPSEPGSTASPSSTGSASSGAAAGQQGTLSPGTATAAPGGIEPAPTPSPSSFQPAPSTSPDPTPAPSVSPSPSASASESGNCIKLGPLGLCVNV